MEGVLDFGDSGEFLIAIFPKPDGSEVRYFLVFDYTVEHPDGAIEYVPSYIDIRRVTPAINEF